MLAGVLERDGVHVNDLRSTPWNFLQVVDGVSDQPHPKVVAVRRVEARGWAERAGIERGAARGSERPRGACLVRRCLFRLGHSRKTEISAEEHAGQEGLQDAAQVPVGTHVVEGLRERARRGVAGVWMRT